MRVSLLGLALSTSTSSSAVHPVHLRPLRLFLAAGAARLRGARCSRWETRVLRPGAHLLAKTKPRTRQRSALKLRVTRCRFGSTRVGPWRTRGPSRASQPLGESYTTGRWATRSPPVIRPLVEAKLASGPDRLKPPSATCVARLLLLLKRPRKRYAVST